MNTYNIPAKQIYLGENGGWHFNKKACDYAVQNLRGMDNKPIKPMSKEEVDEMLKKQGVKLEKNKGWDYVYAANLGKSDMGSGPGTLPDEKSLAQYVKRTIDDPDAADGEVMGCWYTKMIFRHIPVDWEMFL